MRTFPNIQKGTWVAGITGVNTGPDYGGGGIKGNYLFYLFQIDKTFDSQFDYYKYIKDMNETFNSKSSLKNRLGDIYTPIKTLKDDEKYDPHFYRSPLKDHIHFRRNNWHRDIKKVARNFRGNVVETNHKLLLGGETNNFVWEKPIIQLSEDNKIGEGQRTSSIKEFLALFS